MTGVYIPITPQMVTAAADVLRDHDGGVTLDECVHDMLQAAFKAAEISMGHDTPDVVTLTFTNHQKDVESIRLPVGAAHPYDFGPRGLAFRKVQVTR